MNLVLKNFRFFQTKLIYSYLCLLTGFSLNGLVHSGFLLEETKDQTTFRELNGTTKLISNLKIEFKKFTGASLMPSGLLNGLSDAQLKDFFAYLRSTTPPF